MSTDAQGSRERPIFVGRIVLVVSFFGLLFAATELATGWGSYSQPGVAVGAFIATAVVPIVAVLVASRHGEELPGWWFIAVILTLLVVDLVVPALVPLSERFSPATWNWGAAAIVLLGLAAYRPARDVTAAATVHATLGVATTWQAGPGGTTDPIAIAILVNVALVAPLAASQFLHLYVRAVALREAAISDLRQADAQRQAEAAVRGDLEGRLVRVSASVQPLLRAVADGMALPLDNTTAEQAQTLADGLRRELVRQTEHGGLIPTDAIDPSGSPAISLDVRGAVDQVGLRVRTELGGLVSLLYRWPTWTRLTVNVVAATDARKVRVILVAEGPAARDASRDPAVVASTAALSATTWLDEHERLVIETGARAEDDAPSASMTVPQS